jgi:hypothetical protein
MAEGDILILLCHGRLHAGPPAGESPDGDKFKIFIAKIYLT